jgi:hypothetical protein
MILTSRVAFAYVTECEADAAFKEPHLRYTAWSNKHARQFELQRERVVLVYDNPSVDGILSKAKYDFSCRGVRAHHTLERGAETMLYLSATVNVKAELEIVHLGDYGDIACHAIVKRKLPEVGHLSISNMPIYGRSSGFYHASTVMRSFEGASIVNTIHAGDRAEERKLFEFVDKEVQARFAPQPQTTQETS